MPDVIVLVKTFISWVGMQTAVALNIATGATMAIGAAVIVGGTLVVSKAMSLFEVEMPTVDTDASRQTTVKSTTAPQKIIYGEALVSGPISYIGLSGADNKDLYQTIVLAGHEVTDITDIHMDDVVISNSYIDGGSAAGGAVSSGSVEFGPKGSPSTTMCVINKYRGTASQTADPLFTAAFNIGPAGSHYTSDHRGRGIAYLAMKWTLNEDTSESWEKYAPQNVKALVQGKAVYDPRTLTTVYSTNPALCVADYLTDTVLGMGIPTTKIDWPAVTIAANGCDVEVDVPGSVGAKEYRFTCNGVIFATDSHQKNINKILSSMNGNIVYSNGMYIIRAGIYEATSGALNEDDLIGAISIKTSAERSDRFNTIKGLFIDPSQNHKSSEFPKVQLDDAVTRDNDEILEKEVQYPMTNSSFMAQRLSHKLILQSSQQKVVTFPANMSALRITAGDRVAVSIEELSWASKEFICVGWAFSEEGGVDLTLREDDADAYADPTLVPLEYSTITASGDITDAFRGVPAPSGLGAISGEGKVFLDWVNPGKPNDYQTIDVYASPTNNFSSATKIGTTKANEFTHTNTNVADPIAVTTNPVTVRFYWVRAVRNVGTDAASQSSLEPSVVSSVSATVVATEVDWSNVADPTIGIDITSDIISIDLGTTSSTTGKDVAQSGISEDVTISSGGILMQDGGAIRGGQSAYNSGTGFFLGYESSLYKFSIGNGSTQFLTFDGTNFAVGGSISATTGAIGGFLIGADYVKDAADSMGLSSTVTAGDDVRFWAGETFANRATAPFRVTEAGVFTATSAVITGAITATSGSFTGNVSVSTGAMYGGTMTSFNTGKGFFLGYHTDAYKLSVGDANGEVLTWDGSKLNVEANTVSFSTGGEQDYSSESRYTTSQKSATVVLADDSSYFMFDTRRQDLAFPDFIVSYYLGPLTSGTQSSLVNARNGIMDSIKVELFYADASTGSPVTWTSFRSITAGSWYTDTGLGDMFSKFRVKDSGTYVASLDTRNGILGDYPTIAPFGDQLDGTSVPVGLVDNDYFINMPISKNTFVFPKGKYFIKVVITVTNGSLSPYPSTGSPTATERRISVPNAQSFSHPTYGQSVFVNGSHTTVFSDNERHNETLIKGGSVYLMSKEGANADDHDSTAIFFGGRGTTGGTPNANYGPLHGLYFFNDRDAIGSGNGILGSIGSPDFSIYVPYDGNKLTFEGDANFTDGLYINGVAVNAGAVTGPAGADTQVQFNNSGSLGASADFTFNDSTDTLTVKNLTVSGTTTTVNVADLNVADKDITLNYSTGDSSSTANNAGIIIQDAVSSTTDASILWKTASDTFEFSHGANIPKTYFKATDQDAESGTWTSSTTGASWGTIKLAAGYSYTYNAGAYKQYNIPTGADTCYMSLLKWSDGGYVDVHAIQADGDLVFLGRISTGQSVENTNEGDAIEHDGQAIVKIGTGLSSFSSIRITNKRGTFYLTGLAFSTQELDNFDSGMIAAETIHSGVLSNVTNLGWDAAYAYSLVGHLPLAGGTLTGAVSWPSGSSTNANTAYTYSQVGHLPLSGGTLSSSSTSFNGLTIGDSSQTDYSNLVLKAANGTGTQSVEMFKGSDTYTSWGGVDAFNIYTSKGTINFHPAGGQDRLVVETGRVYTKNAYLLVGNNDTNNSYDTVATGNIYFGGLNTSNPEHYSIGVGVKEDVGGDYTKLDIQWHTGVRIGASKAYGGTRFYNNSMSHSGVNKIFSVGEGDDKVRVYNDLNVSGNANLSGQIYLNKIGADSLIDVAGNSSHDPVLNLRSDQGAITTEGFQIWYDNSVGDVHLHTTFADDTAAIRFHTATGTDKATNNERFTINGNGLINIVSGNLAMGGLAVIDSSRDITARNITATGVGTTPFSLTGDSAILYLSLGSATQTEYTGMQYTTDDGNAQFWKTGSDYTGWGGADAFNVYNSNGNISFHPSGTANVLKLESSLITATKNIALNNTTTYASLTLAGGQTGGVSYALHNAIPGVANGGFSIRRAGSVNTLAFDTSDNATFAGAISSGALTSTGNSSHGGYSSWTAGSGTGGIFMHYNATNSYRGYFDWRTLQLGNNGANNILAGNTDAGGYFKFWVNATAISQAGGTSGINALTLAATGNATFSGTISSGAITSTGSVSATQFVLPSTAGATGHYLVTNNTNTGTGQLYIQSGGGSAAYGGGLVLYSHSHASKPGWVTAGISSGSGGKFTVNPTGNGTASDVFTVDVSGNTVASGTISSGAITSSGTISSGAITSSGTSAINNFRLTDSSKMGFGEVKAGGSIGHTATVDEGIFWHSNSEYGIYRTAGAWSGNYQQLTLNWATGINIDGGSAYGLSGVDIKTSGTSRLKVNASGSITVAGAITSSSTISSGAITSTGISGTSVVQSIRNPSTSWSQYALTRYGSEGANVRYMDFGYYRGASEATRGLVIKSQADATLFTFLDTGELISSGAITATNLTLTDNGSAGVPLLRISADDASPWALQLYREDLLGGPQMYASDASTFSMSGHVDIRSGFVLRMNGSLVIDSSKNIAAVGGSFTNNVYIAGTAYSGLSIGETATNYGSWDRQLTLNGDGHARMQAKTTAGIQMGMYAHDTWLNSGGGYLGTYNNYKVTFIISGASAGYIDTSRRLTWQHSVLIGGEWTKNSYNQVSSTSLAFGGGNDLNNYSIGTSMENYGGNYTKLNIKWHTGIRFFVQSTYGGVRFFNDAAMTSELMSIGKGDTGVRIAGLLHANGGLSQDGHTLINGSDTWYRTTADGGLFCSTYAGGINMLDTTWVRVYNGKALYVPNQIAATGNITAYYSDERLKTKTGNIENALDKVRSLSGFNYVENDLAKELGYTNEKQQVGLSAQQVQAVLPEAVSLAPVDMETDEFSGEITSKSGENYLTVDYSRLVPLLVEAIKEQQEQIDELKLKLKEK